MLGKLIKIDILNIGKIKHIEEQINKPLVIFYGDVEQGKSTILKTFLWGCGGPFPSDILRKDTNEGHIYNTFENGVIQREFYVGKDGTTKARDVNCIIDNKTIGVKELKRLLNPFLLDQDFYSKKNLQEKKKYFVELFDIDTAKEDTALEELAKKAKELRFKIKFYGNIDTTPKTPVNIDELQEKKDKINKEHEIAVKKREADNKKIKDYNKSYNDKLKRVDEINFKIKELNEEKTELEIFLNVNKIKPEISIIPLPSTQDIDNEINNGIKQNAEYTQYQERVKKQAEKEKDQIELRNIEQKTRDIKKDKLNKLKSISSACIIPGLEFGDDITFEGTAIDMISNSQEMRLSNLLSSLYPRGIGIELIDRGESFGKKKIFDFVSRAKEKDSTILMTVVDEKPAQIPADVGVFVVDNGEIKI